MRNEQAIFERVGLETEARRGFGTSDEVYFDRLEDQFNRLLESIDAAANAMGMVLDLQLNERAYVVNVVATIFVPLTFVTGFFGTSFGWMVDRVDSPVAFWLLGCIVPIATAALSWVSWCARSSSAATCGSAAHRRWSSARPEQVALQVSVSPASR